MSLFKSPACLSEQARPKQKYETNAQYKGKQEEPKREKEGKICRKTAKNKWIRPRASFLVA